MDRPDNVPLLQSTYYWGRGAKYRGSVILLFQSCRWGIQANIKYHLRISHSIVIAWRNVQQLASQPSLKTAVFLLVSLVQQAVDPAEIRSQSQGKRSLEIQWKKNVTLAHCNLLPCVTIVISPEHCVNRNVWQWNVLTQKHFVPTSCKCQTEEIMAPAWPKFVFRARGSLQGL